MTLTILHSCLEVWTLTSKYRFERVVQYCGLAFIGKNRSFTWPIRSIWWIENFLDDPTSRVFYLPFASHYRHYRNISRYSGTQVASFAALFRLVPPHKRLLNRAIHSFPIVSLPRQANQSRSRYCVTVTNQKNRFKVSREVYFLLAGVFLLWLWNIECWVLCSSEFGMIRWIRHRINYWLWIYVFFMQFFDPVICWKG